MNAPYQPRPVDTSRVELTPELQRLGEMLAKNTHENWSAQRLADGWVWGPERDDERKLHPCLVPYEELTEEEKDYDRRTAWETLKVLLAMGFDIRKG